MKRNVTVKEIGGSYTEILSDSILSMNSVKLFDFCWENRVQGFSVWVSNLEIL